MARVKGQREYNQSWLYDLVRLPAGAAVQIANFFTVVRGQPIVPGVLKTYTHTNLDTPGFLSGIKTFEISSICFVPDAFIDSANVNGLCNGNAALLINSKPFPDYFPLRFFMGGPSWRESVRGPAALANQVAYPGDARIDNVVQFGGPYKIEIDTLENFRVDVSWDAGWIPNEQIDLRILFFGLAGREVM